MMSIEAYQLDSDSPSLVPGRVNRSWMDETSDRFAYRCLPLTISNTAGWECHSPYSFSMKWNGGNRKEDITFHSDTDLTQLSRFCLSHFAHGIVTFHLGYLFRTPPEWGIWVMGAPNRPKHGIQPLSGLVETDWLPFPSTMNWQFTAPGEVHFDAGEPFAFISPVKYTAFEKFEPKMLKIDDNPELKSQYELWMNDRNAFLDGLSKGEDSILKRAWQRDYFLGRYGDGSKGNQRHIHKLRLKDFL